MVGPLVSAAQRERVERFVARGDRGRRDAGLRRASGPPHLPRGFYVEPTLFTGAHNDMAIAREEIFGPVITAIPFRDEDEAIALANDSDYGLYGYVWSGDTARGLRVAEALRTGTVQINGSSGEPGRAVRRLQAERHRPRRRPLRSQHLQRTEVHRVDGMRGGAGSPVRRAELSGPRCRIRERQH